MIPIKAMRKDKKGKLYCKPGNRTFYNKSQKRGKNEKTKTRRS